MEMYMYMCMCIIVKVHVHVLCSQKVQAKTVESARDLRREADLTFLNGVSESTGGLKL